MTAIEERAAGVRAGRDRALEHATPLQHRRPEAATEDGELLAGEPGEFGWAVDVYRAITGGLSGAGSRTSSGRRPRAIPRGSTTNTSRSGSCKAHLGCGTRLRMELAVDTRLRREDQPFLGPGPGRGSLRPSVFV
jgi:hypothetical protein